MNLSVNPGNVLEQLTLPEQDIELLAFSMSNRVTVVAEWIASLKLTQIQQTSALLYQAIPQIVRLRTSAKNRFEILELIRPAIHHCISGLTKSFLNQPLLLPEQAQKMAIIAQALQKNMVDGYTICLRDWTKKGVIKQANQEKACISLHRALTGIGLLSLRSYQLYIPVPNGVWLRAHTLYRVAAFNNLLKSRVHDELFTHKRSFIRDAYARVMTMACSRLNQLTQNDVFSIFSALESWSEHIELMHELPEKLGSIHVADLEQDKPPTTKKRHRFNAENELIGVNFDPLCQLLEQAAEGESDLIGSNASFKVPTEMPDAVVKHLVTAWRQIGKRENKRQESEREAEICIGFINCHVQLCGNIDFSTFVADPMPADENYYAPKISDSSQNFNDKGDPIAPVKVRNEGEEGYCLSLEEYYGQKIESGDLITIREKGRRRWKLGVVRWIRRLREHSLIGVQLLSAKPEPYGISMFYDVGGYSDYMRAFYLPSNHRSDKPYSIITAPVPFKENAKVRLKQDERIFKTHLGFKLLTTAKMSQFEINPKNLEPVENPNYQ